MPDQSAQPNPQLQRAQELFNGLSQSRKIVLIASVVGFIATLLPWYTVSVHFGTITSSGSENGWHGWGLLAMLLFIVGAAWVVLPLLGVSIQGLLATLPPTVTEPRLVMGIGGVAALCTLIFMVTEGGGVSGAGISAGPSLGAYLGLICALAIAAGGYLRQSERP
jgi:hypothetical protein